MQSRDGLPRVYCRLLQWYQTLGLTESLETSLARHTVRPLYTQEVTELAGVNNAPLVQGHSPFSLIHCAVASSPV